MIEVLIFQKKLETLKTFLSELASREEEIVTFGLKRVVEWDSFSESKPIIDDFEYDYSEIESISKYIDAEVHSQLKKLREESKIIEELAIISVQFDVLSQKRNMPVAGEITNTILFQLPYLSGIFKNRQLFSKEKISIQSILVSITRMRSMVKRLEQKSRLTAKLDDEIFRPSNVDLDLLMDRMDSAIFELQKVGTFPVTEKERLIEYIKAAKLELASEKPSWSKVVGALVVVATLLGGVAVAPMAYDNVTQAIQHILGVSIEKHVPNILLPPDQNENSDLDTIVT